MYVCGVRIHLFKAGSYICRWHCTAYKAHAYFCAALFTSFLVFIRPSPLMILFTSSYCSYTRACTSSYLCPHIPHKCWLFLNLPLVTMRFYDGVDSIEAASIHFVISAAASMVVLASTLWFSSVFAICLQRSACSPCGILPFIYTFRTRQGSYLTCRLQTACKKHWRLNTNGSLNADRQLSALRESVSFS